MSKFHPLRGETTSDPPLLIRRSTHVAVRVNVVAFLILGSIALISDLPQFLKGVAPSQSSITMFALLAPIWTGGAYYAIEFLRGHSPSIPRAANFAWKSTLVLAAPPAFAYLSLGAGPDSSIADSVAIASAAILSVFCFVTYGLLNGLFGIWLTTVNVLLLVSKLLHGDRFDPLLWFNLLGLIQVDSALVSWALILGTIVVGLVERTFRLLDAAST